MEQRKYFKSRITELEEVYNKNKANVAILEELEEELHHRSTHRARQLLHAVQSSLNANTASPPSQALFKPSHDSSSTVSITPFDIEAPIDWDMVLNNPGIIAPFSEETKEERIIQNQASDILDAWTVLEALSPQTYKKPHDLVIGQGSVAYLKQGQEPWVEGEKSIPKTNLYYVVYLGAVDIEKATQKLLTVYQDKRIERPNARGFASLGVIIVDKHGVPIPDSGFGIASFGWSYAWALQGKLHELKSWNAAEQVLKKGLEKVLYRQDEDGNELPLTLSCVKEAYQWLISSCGIPVEDVVEPDFAVRLYQPFSKWQPEVPLLNSFYLDDLQSAKEAVQSKSAGEALSLYLGITKPKQYVDILKDKQHIEYGLQPKNMPEARWPSNGRHSLVLLQQTAVNLARMELANGGLFSVNGPPGTGKTTLLRDIMTSVLVDRAKALCKFSTVDDAFKHAGQMKLGNGFVHLYTLHESLRGHEILVASTNNKAVENVSKELPLKAQIAADIEGFEYFKTISDALGSSENETWGLCAAVLGNSKNRGEFTNKAWWDKDSGLRNYFLSITGQFTPEMNEQGEEIIPKIIEECDPPRSIEEAQQRWKKACISFQEALTKAQNAINKSQSAYESTLEIKKLNAEIEELLSEEESLAVRIQSLEEHNTTLLNRLEEQKKRLEATAAEEKQSKKVKPGFLKRFFAKNEWKDWKNAHAQLVAHKKEIFKECQASESQVIECKSSLSTSLESLVGIQESIKSCRSECDTHLAKIGKVSSICGGKLITSDMWSLEHHDQQIFSPNFTNDAQRLRDDVFVAAIRLHKAFIDASSKQLRQNLGAFFACLGGKILPHDKQVLLPHLWSSMFLVTPVISTAFASVGRMLTSMPKESIGWLLVDEAGQATPQAAIGAIYRAKRVICVGDPLQIEPVVTLPSILVEAISKHIGVDADRWMAPSASIQTLSDTANNFGTTIPRGLSEIRIGLPLLVHRRCENPMFNISNRLAYNGLMVQATIPEPSDITALFGAQSKWYDIQGGAQEKWCPEEGEHVTQMLLQYFVTCNGEPQIYVISPFKMVAERMRQRMLVEKAKLISLGIKDPNDWVYNNIGTVHTFQGKETKAVILLLGAPSPTQNGAREWATSNINLLNVAVSRAKQNFYVVGNRALWGNLGNMKLVSGYL